MIGANQGTRCILALMVVSALPACSSDPPLPGATELEAISVRTLQSEVLRSLPSGPRGPGGNVVKGHRMDRMFVEGGWVEVLWLEAPESVEAGADPRLSLNPVIFRDEGLDGWGWDHFDERASQWGIPEPEQTGAESESEQGPEEEPRAEPPAVTI